MLVELRSLSLRLGGTPVLRDVSLSLAAGEIYGLIGPNGAGKTTTLAVVLGLRVPDAGRVRVFGRDPRRTPAGLRVRIGVLPERNGLYEWMTGLEYLEFFAALNRPGYSCAGLAARLEQVGLDPTDGRSIGPWSRGMRQRLGLARALLADPALLVLDEPTHGLDPRGRREVHALLREHSSRLGAGVLLCTHLLDDVDRLCDRVGVLRAGCTVAEGRIADLARGSAHRPRFRLQLAGPPPVPERLPPAVTRTSAEGDALVVELDPAAEPDQVWRELLFLGWPVTEIRREGGRLEELYLKLTEREAA